MCVFAKCYPATCSSSSSIHQSLPASVVVNVTVSKHFAEFQHKPWEDIGDAMLQELASGRTSVFVAHRLSTVQRCDKIIVLSNGVVAEQGTHEELMAAQRIYYDMWEVQKAADAEAEKVSLSSFSSYDDPNLNLHGNGNGHHSGVHPGREMQTSQV